jgi:hypothetical protein
MFPSIMRSLFQPVAGQDVQNPHDKKSDRAGNKNRILQHITLLYRNLICSLSLLSQFEPMEAPAVELTQNLTNMSISMNGWSLRRSGNQTLLSPPPQAVSAADSVIWPEDAPVAQT